MKKFKTPDIKCSMILILNVNVMHTCHFQVFVQHNSIYYLADPWDQHPKPEVVALDPGTGDIFNGVPDWVYEGERETFDI